MATLISKFRFAKTLINKDEYEKMADNLIRFVQLESTLDIDSFPLSLTIDPEVFAGWSNESEYFKSAYKTSIRIIGSRLKTLMYHGVLDRAAVLEILPMYDPEYRKSLMYLKQKDDTVPGQTKIVVVHMPMVEETPLVTAKLEQIRAKNEALENER